MKNIKLNKLAKNRLQEKEMRHLIGGGKSITDWEYNIYCSSEEQACCESLCTCTYSIPFANPVSSNGDSSSSSSMKKLA